MAKAKRTVAGPRKVRRMVIQPATNGGFISRTEREPAPRGAGMAFADPDQDETNVHPTVGHLAAHIQNTFPDMSAKARAARAIAAKAKARGAAPMGRVTAAIGNSMLGGI